MRIGVDAHLLTIPEELKRSGGTYLVSLVSNMAELGSRDSFLLYLNRSSCIVQFNDPNVHLRPIPGPPVVWRQVLLPFAAMRDKIDVLFIPFHSVPRFWFRPMVVVIHGLAFLTRPQYFSTETVSYLEKVTAFAVKRASYVIAVSNSTKQDILNYYGKSLEEKIEVIYEAPKSIFRPGKPNDSAESSLLSTLGEGQYFVAVGTHPIKNLSGTVEALTILRNRGFDARLMVVGGITEPFLKSLPYTKTAKENVIFTGPLAAEELRSLYANAVALVFPSFYEGFGLPLVEAMACGCPVIASDVSSVPEIVGDAGILVNPHKPVAIADAMQEVLENLSLREHLSTKGLLRATSFSWKTAAKKTIGVLERAIQ